MATQIRLSYGKSTKKETRLFKEIAYQFRICVACQHAVPINRFFDTACKFNYFVFLYISLLASRRK